MRNRAIQLWRLVQRNRGELLFAIGTISSPVSAMVGGVVSARCLLPGEMGILNTASLFPAYLAFLHFGVFSGLARNLPMELGAGKEESAWRLLHASGSAATWIASLGSVCCLSAAVVNEMRGGDRLLTWSLALSSLPVFAGTLAIHIDTSLRGLNRFMPLSLITLGTSALTAGSSILIALFGFTGAMLRLSICAVASICLRLGARVWSPRWPTDWSTTSTLARHGTPLMLSSAFFSFLSVADRSIVALLLEKEEVGHFALAGLIVNSLIFVPQSISMILFPKMARHYGTTRSPRSLRRYLLINLVFNLATVVPISLIGYWGVEPLVQNLFPRYADGIPAAKIACMTGICWIYLGVGSVIGVLNRMTPYLIAMVAALLIIWASGYYLVSHGYGIAGAAWGRFFGTLFLCLFTLVYSWYLTSTDESQSKA